MTNDDIADKANRNLLMENMQLIKEIESSSMECQDYLSHLKINACQEEIRQRQRSLILNMFACMCLAKVKILKIEQSKKDSNTIEGFVDDMNGNIVDMVNQLEEGRNKLLEEEGKFSERKRQVEVMTRKQRKYSDILKYKLK